jgi:hypothetical protein
VTYDRKDEGVARGRRSRGPRAIKEAFGPASQAEMYLLRALEEFHHAGNPPDLWKPVAGMLKGSLLEGAQAIGDAKNARLRFLRGTVLYAALGIEAFANELLAELLVARDFDAVDRLEVPDKLLIGTRLATGESPLSRGRQPLQDVAILVKKRNRLVHAKPQNGIAAWIQNIEDADEDAVGPNAALTAILRVAETMEICNELRRHPNLHAGIAKTVVRYRQLLVTHSQLTGPKIMDVPDRAAPEVAPLWDQMRDASAKRAGVRSGTRGEGRLVRNGGLEGGDPEELLAEAIAEGDDDGPAGRDHPKLRGEVKD